MVYVLIGAFLLCLVSAVGGFAARTRLARTPTDAAGAIDVSAPDLRGWFTAARAVLRPDWWIASAAAWLMLVDTALALAAPLPVAIVIDHVLGHRSLPAMLAPLKHLGAVPATVCVAAAGLVLLAAGALVGYLVGYLATSLAERTAARLRLATMSHLMRVAPARVTGYATGELANRVNSDTGRVADTLVTVVETLVPETALLVGMALITGLLDWRLTLCALVIVPLFVVTARIRNRSVEPAARISRARAGELSSLITDVLSRLPVVHVFGQARAELAEFRRVSASSARATIEAVDAGARFTPVTDTLPGIGLAAALVAGAIEVRSGHLSLGGLVLFLSYLSSLTTPVHALAGLSGTLARGVASRDRLRELLNVAHLVPGAASVVAARQPRPASRVAAPSRIDVSEVSVAHSATQRVIDNVTFRVDPGEFVCLTGPSGAGKTTVLSLLCRLVEPTAGQISVGGRNIASIPLAELRRLITLVPQEPWLRTGSVADNIRYGRPEATIDEVRGAAERVGAAEFIDRLPFGYGTPVGEHGRHLSGGQQRRLALARALLCDTPTLLLDEPTNGLDRRSQADLIDVVRAMGDRTVVVATHHRELIRAADRVIDLQVPSGYPRVLTSATR